MAVSTILPQRVDPATLRPLADLLSATQPDPAFARALDRALDYIEAGAAYEPFNATHYRVESHSQPYLWHYVTLDQCSCQAKAPWCWHRALLHLLTAHAALLDLHRCPRPQLAHIPPHDPQDYDALTRACDEMF